MKEYYGSSAKKYGMTKGKRLLLSPAIARNLPRAKNKSSKFLDVACGNGDFYNLSEQNGYQYHGFDISKDMLDIARSKYPLGLYQTADARNFTKLYKEKFDVVLVSMLFPSIDSRQSIVKILKNCKIVLKEGGVIILGVTHPCFDHYMQKFLFERGDVETSFNGYFDSGNKFKMHQYINDEEFIFRDYHWTLADYIKSIKEAGLNINSLDECKSAENTIEELSFARKRNNFPTYLVISSHKGSPCEKICFKPYSEQLLLT